MHLRHTCGKHDRLDSVESHYVRVASAAALCSHRFAADALAGLEHSLYHRIVVRNIEAYIVCLQLDLKLCSHLVAGILQALGGAANIESVNNCATRLRIALVDMAKTQSDDVFKALGAHGVVRRGNGIQVIVGLHVPQVRDQLESLMKHSLPTEQTTMTEAVS